MALKLTLNDRQSQVLRATVQRYIATAEPVGSEVLVKEYNLSVSSATIRNAMGYLEKAGLLYQPHVSAGRIPSDSGYRLYVDRLIKTDRSPPMAIPQGLNQLLGGQFGLEVGSLESILKGAAQLLATLSGYITLITLPLNRTTELKHLQLVPVDRDRVMLIVVTDSYETQSVMLNLPPSEGREESELVERELQILSNFLNDQLRGKSLVELEQLDWQLLGQDFDRYGNLLQTIIQDIRRRLNQSAVPSQFVMSGVSEVLRQPEFMELGQLQMILQLLEGAQHQVVPLMFEPSSLQDAGRSLNVWIGAENPLEPMRGCSLLSATYHRGDTLVGSVGVVGPTRMAYEGTIALVKATADYLSDLLTQAGHSSRGA
jgi:heat-inducible transcriptional repressor